MTNLVKENDLESILLANPDGIVFEQLREKFSDTATNLSSQAQDLWSNYRLVGVTEDGCCGQICGPSCVSYMKEDRVWKYIKY